MDNNEDILARYLEGELSAEQKQVVEKQLSQDPLIAEELESLRRTTAAIRLYGLKERVAGVHGQMMKELVKKPVSKRETSKIIRYSIAIAASIALLIGIYVIYNFATLSSEKVFASRYQPYEMTNLRDGEAVETEMENAFRAKDFKRVVQLKTATSGAKESFLYGAAELELKDNAKAIDGFRNVLVVNKKTNKAILNDEAEYFLALTYIRNKDYDYALPILTKIYNDPNHVYNSKVNKKLLSQVKMLKWR